MPKEKSSVLRLGVWEHWFQPQYKITRFLQEHGVEVQTIDYQSADYLQDIDVLIIEQNGLNDFIENDRAYLHRFVRQGGICWIMHQDYRRFTPGFLPPELGRLRLIHRYVPTLAATDPDLIRHSYLAPWIEPVGRKIVSARRTIRPEEFLYWSVPANSFGVLEPPHPAETVETCAISAITNVAKWDILGSYQDAAWDDAALIIQARYGRGLFFWNQLLFPEVKPEKPDLCLNFWDKFCDNLLYYFQAFKDKKPLREPAFPKPQRRTCHKTAINLHSLDHHSADSNLGVVNAALRYHKIDVGVIALRDADAYENRPDCRKFSDDQVTLIPGLEFHPFNFERSDSHCAYQLLALGDESTTTEFTRALFSTEDVTHYLQAAFEHFKKHHACSCVLHPLDNYWVDYPVDAVEVDWFNPFHGGPLEQAMLQGKKFGLMTACDMFGIQKLRANLVYNFIYMNSPVTPDCLVAAVRARHTMASYGIDSADVRLGQYLPGDVVPRKAAKALQIMLESSKAIREISLWDGAKLIAQETLPPGSKSIGRKFSITPEMQQSPFLRFEARGTNCALRATPFFWA